MTKTGRRTAIAGVALFAAGAASTVLWSRDATLRREERELWAALRREIAAFEASEGPTRDPVPADPAPGSAHEHWRAAARAFAGLEASSFAGRSAEDWLEDLANRDNGSPSVPTALRTRLSEVAALLGPATRTERLPAPWKLLDVDAPEAECPDHAVLRLVYSGWRHLLDEARLRATEGDVDGALDLALLLDRAAAESGGRNWLLPCLMGQEARRMVRVELAGLLSADLLPPGAVDRLEVLLRAAPPIAKPGEWLPGTVSIEMQVAAFHPASGFFATGPRFVVFDPFGTRGPAEKARDEVKTWLEAEPRSRRIAAWREYRETARPRPAETLEDLASRLEALAATRDRAAERRLYRLTGFYLRKLGENDAELRATDAALRIGIAFRRFRLREGRPPATIDEIRPPDVSSAPPAGTWAIEEDPDRGEPCFRYAPPYGFRSPLRIR